MVNKLSVLLSEVETTLERFLWDSFDVWGVDNSTADTGEHSVLSILGRSSSSNESNDQENDSDNESQKSVWDGETWVLHFSSSASEA